MLNLRELRLKKGNLNQEDVAKAIGVSRVTYGIWERDVTSINTKNLIKLAEFFDVSIDELLGHKVLKK